MAEATVQVVMRTKDRPRFLARAIQSVVSQSYGHWYCTIVNDGGDSVAVEKVVAQYAKEAGDRLSVIHNESSRGMEAASNQGLRAFAADYYTIHDDDDSWQPDFLKTCLAVLEKNRDSSVQGVVARTMKVVESVEGDTIKERKIVPFLPEITSFTIPRVVQNNPFMPIAFVYSRKALDRLKGYDESLPVVGDWEFNLRFIRDFDIVYVPDTTAYYHVRAESRGDSTDNSISKALDHQHYRSLIINRHIRGALDEGSLTLGHLLAASEPGVHANRFGEKLNYLYPRLKRLTPGRLLSKLRGRS